MEVCFHHLIAEVSEPMAATVVEDDSAYVDVCRANARAFVHRCLKELPRESTEEGVVCVLDRLRDRKVKLPRFLPCPKPKSAAPRTKWEEFSRAKGLRQKQKRSAFVFDDVAKDYKLRWGGRSLKKAQEQRDFVIEHKRGEDPFRDPFAERAQAKALNKAKNKLQRLNNRVRAQGYKLK